MISFIVIGRNEEKNLKRCFNSIYNTISFTNLKQYEIIYVDSKSTDDSVNIAKSFKEVRVFKIMGVCNAAIARNIGAKEAKGTIFYFIDGDMELNDKFLSGVLDKNGEMKIPLVSGQLIDIVKGRKDEKRLLHTFLPGGIFLIRSKEWNSVNGMSTKFKTGEDMDLGLRLYKSGCYFIRKPDIITYHHTIPGLGRSRIWKMVWNKSFCYSKVVLYRSHLFNKQMYKQLWLADKTLILLVFILMCSFFFPQFIALFISIYLLAIIARSYKQKKYISIFELVWFNIVIDLLNLFFLFTFFPKNHKMKYKEIKSNATETNTNYLNKSL